MNRTDRLLAIVLELQAKGQQRAEDLAATFEISKRTVYRDMLALSEAGVPIVSTPGQGYALVEGYFLPPLTFSTDEAIMLLLGSDFAAQNFDSQYHIAAQVASRKIEAVLPRRLREEIDDLQRSIQFIASSPAAPELLQQLRRAIIERKRVRFVYSARFSAEAENITLARETDPYALMHIAEAWYLVAYCHLRRDIRHFRLERIENLKLLEKTFNRPQDFKIERQPATDRTITVRALFDSQTARWIQESPSFYQVAAEARPEGWLVTLQVRRDEDIVQWLLGWGSHVYVLEPETLRAKLITEALAVAEQYAIFSAAKS